MSGSLELRELAQQGGSYPIEMTLAETQQVFRGRLSAEIAAWCATGDSRADGRSLFEALFASGDAMHSWGAARGRSRPRSISACWRLAPWTWR